MNLNTIKPLVAILALTAFTLLASTASAFEYVNACNSGGGAVWPQNMLPLQWKLNSSGSDDMPFDTIEQIMKTSFAAWEAPCCSRFRSQYTGTTTGTALNNRDLTISFEESSWPRELGSANDGTIAVTLLSFSDSCTIARAPILFNGIAHRFTDQCNASGCAGGGTDVQGVATHEIGHLLGLGHSPVQSSTMFYAYQGGDSSRSLHPDDTAGVCDLYPGSCSCNSDNDCLGDREECSGGMCQFVPCTNDTQCSQDLVCDAQGSGRCVVPPCTSNASCGDGFTCTQGSCVSNCPICRECTSSTQCGAGGSCVDFNQDGAGECITQCEASTGLCPGDSQCYQVPIEGDTYFLCLNPDVTSAGVCPATYTCDDTVVQDACDNVSCPSNQECRNGQCFDTSVPDACADIKCASNKVCVDGECITQADPCENVRCASGKVCMEGACVEDTGTNNNNNNGDGDVIIVDKPGTPTTTNQSCTGNSTTGSGAPPTSLVLVGLGMAIVALRRRKKRRA